VNYRVIVEDTAEDDLEAIVSWLAQYSEEAANTWYWQVRDAIASLESFPMRCSIAPESSRFDEEVRNLLHGRRSKYRILFTIRGSNVHVLHVRHDAREPLDPGTM